MADETIKTILTADETEFRASFERAAATLRKHESRLDDLKKKSLSRVTEELKALKLEASGQKAAADSQRETMSLREKALALAKQTGLSEQASMVLLQKRAALEKQVAAESVRRSQPVSLSGLPVNNLQDLDKLNRVAAQSAQQMNRLRSGGQNASMGLLEISRAAEDAQYGLRGVINNVPGIVQSFGGSAGIAGAVSLAVVAFYQLGKAYMAYLDSIDNQQGFKEGFALREAGLKADFERLRVLREEERIQSAINDYSKEYNAVLEKELSIQKGVAEVIEGRMEQRRRERQYADEIAAAQERLADARGLSAPDRAATEAARMLEDLKAQQELLKANNREASRLDFSRQDLSATSAAEIEASLAAIEQLRPQLAEAENRLKDAAHLLKTTKAGSGVFEAQQSVKSQTENRNRLKSELDTLEKQLAVQREIASTRESKSAAAMDAINERIAATMGEITSLEKLIETRKKVAAIDAQAREEKARNEALKERAKLLDKVNRALVDGLDRAEAQMRLQKDQAQAQADFGGEIRALRLEASGRKDMADALRNELRIREDAAALAERTGVSEEKAMALVRERERLLRQIREGERKEGTESRIRRSARDTGRRIEAGGGRRIEAGGGRRIEAAAWRPGSLTRSGLRESELARQAQVKAAAGNMSGADRAAKYYERSLDLQGEMIGVFKKIGLI